MKSKEEIQTRLNELDRRLYVLKKVEHPDFPMINQVEIKMDVLRWVLRDSV